MNDPIVSKPVEKPWIAYEYGGAYYIGRVVADFPNSVDVAFASFDRTSKSFCTEDVPFRSDDVGEAIAFAISKGSKREDLEKMLREGFPDAKIG